MPNIGRWGVNDPVSESYFSFSPYNYVRNSPIVRIDPTGNWDITIHVHNNREQYGYGIAVVADRHGNEVFRFAVRVQGTAGSNRMKTNADTPLGVYDIPDVDMWKPGETEEALRKSYGPNSRLIMNGMSGEILESGRDAIRIHGGRQEIYDKKTGKWMAVGSPALKKTQGCLRCLDRDVKTLKEITDALMEDDELEFGGRVTILDDLNDFLKANGSEENEGQQNEDCNSADEATRRQANRSFWSSLMRAWNAGSIEDWLKRNGFN